MVELPGWAPRTLARSQSETRTSELRLEAGQIGIFEEHGHVFPRLGRGFASRDARCGHWSPPSSLEVYSNGG